MDVTSSDRLHSSLYWQKRTQYVHRNPNKKHRNLRDIINKTTPTRFRAEVEASNLARNDYKLLIRYDNFEADYNSTQTFQTLLLNSWCQLLWLLCSGTRVRHLDVVSEIIIPFQFPLNESCVPKLNETFGTLCMCTCTWFVSCSYYNLLTIWGRGVWWVALQKVINNTDNDKLALQRLRDKE